MTEKKRSTSSRFASFVVTHARWILIAWLVVAVLAKVLSPSWKAVALDGDFEYLPADQISVSGGRLLDAAFEGTRSRSQMVVTLGHESEQWTTADRLIGMDILRRLYHRLAEVSLRRAETLRTGEAPPRAIIAPRPLLTKPPQTGIDAVHADAEQPSDAQEGTPLADSEKVQDSPPSLAERWLEVAATALDQAIEIDSEFYELLGDRVPEKAPTAYEPRLAIAYWDRGRLSLPGSREASERITDLESAVVLDANISSHATAIGERSLDAWMVLLDVYSWQDSVIGSQLMRPNARIAVLTLASELAATGNIDLLEQLQQLIDRCVSYQQEYLHEDEKRAAQDLQIYITGSAAIGGQTLQAARSAISFTEWFTVLMILIILAVVYRAPLLVAVPLVSIAIAVMVASALVTFLTSASQSLAIPGLDLRIYTTSRIFVIVLLFGAGTDYCLFLISRLREEAMSHPWPIACRRALENVSGALIGSALTTIVGLGMLWFADFGKFHHTGPIIAICLSVGLMVCMTLTPSVLRLLGPIVFWPTGIVAKAERPKLTLLSNNSVGDIETTGGRLWNAMAIALTRYPKWTLIGGVLLLSMPAIGGLIHERSVTYDLSGQLDWNASSRQGMRLLDRNFGVGELAPVSILALAQRDQPEETLTKLGDRLTGLLYQIEGVRRVRSMSDPLGDFPPDREMGLLSSDAWRRRALQNHRLARSHFVATQAAYEQRLIRLDVIVEEDPFSQAAADRLSTISTEVRQSLKQAEAQSGTKWDLLYVGTTPSIVDLREVTMSDTWRIKMAVILAVFAILILVIRRWVLSLYLIATVLLSYYATLGLTYWFFRLIDGPEFLGLDWKLPLFLFVILVAVGQDYNVYLVTRIMEERRKLGSLAAVRRAVARTGGIVTACGFVMAATFFSMTASAWWPAVQELFWHPGGDNVAVQQTTLRGITELGFALGLGVLIDTLYVRTVLVPSFVVLLDRWRKTSL